MIKKTKKVQKSDFSLLKNTKSASSDVLFVKIAPLPSSKTQARFSVIVSKKVAKKAVDRNKVKRRAYAAIKEIEHKVKPAIYVFYFKNTREIPELKDIKMNINTVLKKTESL